MRMEAPLSRVRGLGSARSGAHHWWTERLTSVAVLVLSIWLLASLLRLPALDHGTVREWLRQPLAAVPMLLFVVALFWHAKLGMQVVIEDYVHEAGAKLFSIVLLNFFAIAGAALAFYSVLSLAFSAEPAPAAPAR
jgi:succinate dehydrogenase / fumarate reductase membrane anchor subunit